MRGIDKFKERFAGHDGEYVLIGGGARDLLFGEAGQDFRATKDLDLVLLVEALTPEFGQVFWDFVKEGGYENRQKSSGKPQFYRFSKPEDPAFPAMLELFARTDVGLRDAESGLMPIHIDDEVSSLSAILLDDEYYRLLVENRASAGGVAVLSVEGLIPFKAKAWLDLSARRAGGQAVDEKSVKKVLLKEGARADEALAACRAILADESRAWEAGTLEAACRELGEEDALNMKLKLVLQPLRVAVCGNMVSPPLFESIELLPREDVIARIDQVTAEVFGGNE